MSWVPCSIFYPGDRVRSGSTEGVITDDFPGDGVVASQDRVQRAAIRRADGGITFVSLSGLEAWQDDEPAPRSRSRSVAVTVAALGWLGILAGVALIALDPGRGWIGVSVIMAALVGASAALAWLRRHPVPDDAPGLAEPDGGPWPCDHGGSGSAS